MNRKLIITLIIVEAVIIGAIGTFITVNVFKDNKTPTDINSPNVTNSNDNGNSTDNDNNQPNNSEEKIKLFGKEYDTLDKVPYEDMKEYLKQIEILFAEKTYENFTDEDITMLVAAKYFQPYVEPYTIETIRNYVKELFGIENFQVKEGRYLYPNYNRDYVTIEKSGEKYSVSNYFILKSETTFNSYISKETSGNQIIVHYNYVQVNMSDFSHTYFGKTDIYLKYINNSLRLEKIIYTEDK